MKWQRARLRIAPDTVPAVVAMGPLFWVRCGKPLVGDFGQGDDPLWQEYYDTNRELTWNGRRKLLVLTRESVELLPEFSDADNPDEETRQ